MKAAQQIGTPELRAKIATDSLGTASGEEAGGTVVRSPREEGEFRDS